jgi:hypothetical protein
MDLLKTTIEENSNNITNVDGYLSKNPKSSISESQDFKPVSNNIIELPSIVDNPCRVLANFDLLR